MSIWNRLALVAPPEGDVLALDDAKRHLRIELDEDEFDAEVADYVADAVAQVDGPEGIGLALLTQTWRLSLDTWPRMITIPLRPIQTVDAITYVDPAGVTQTLAADQYAYDLDRKPLQIYPAQTACWPALKPMPGAIKVEFTAGFGDASGDIPGDLIGAIKLLVGHRWAYREVGTEGGTVTELPLGVAATLGRYGKPIA